jgi:hypothetical protein
LEYSRGIILIRDVNHVFFGFFFSSSQNEQSDVDGRADVGRGLPEASDGFTMSQSQQQRQQDHGSAPAGVGGGERKSEKRGV